jgi:tetratricopeptide (TPR) repeat protein
MVLCVADDDGIKRLAPPEWKPQDAIHLTSMFEEAPERYYIAVRSDARAGEQEGINPYYNAYWSYVGLTIRSSVGARLPSWFISGIAGVMANTLVRSNEVQVGRILPANIRQLRQASRIRLRQLIVDDAESPAYADPERLRVFHAEATVLLHMLLFGDEHNQRAGQVDAFLNRLRGGEPPSAAFEKTFGSPDTLESEFVQYFSRSILTFRRLPADLRVAPERWPSHRLTVAEASTALAGYHVAIKRFDDAAGEIRQAREADKAMASTFDVEALLLDQGSERDNVRAAFEKAVDAGSTSFYTYYRLAQMLSGDTSRAAVTRRQTLLERSVAANSRFASAQAMLSEVKAQLGKTSEAVDLGRKAVEMEPSAFSAHYALARALAADHPVDALRESRQAAALARDDSQKQRRRRSGSTLRTPRSLICHRCPNHRRHRLTPYELVGKCSSRSRPKT